MEKDVLRKLQMTEYEMLKDVAAFCDNNGIKYFLSSGTVLGAVRHGGFIPWDDDIDMGMDLKNYKKFLRLAPKGLPKKYFVQHFTTDPKVSIPWIKVRINGTTSMERDLTNFDIHYGICMDIFLFNGIAESSFRQKLQKKYSKCQREMLRKDLFIARNVANYSPKYVRKLPEFIRRILIRITDRIVNIDCSKTSKCYNTYYEDIEKSNIYDTGLFKELKKIKFVDDFFYAPSQLEKYLVATYGDWQTLPPEEERIAHGDIIIDFNNDYSTYQEKSSVL